MRENYAGKLSTYARTAAAGYGLDENVLSGAIGENSGVDTILKTAAQLRTTKAEQLAMPEMPEVQKPPMLERIKESYQAVRERGIVGAVADSFVGEAVGGAVDSAKEFGGRLIIYIIAALIILFGIYVLIVRSGNNGTV